MHSAARPDGGEHVNNATIAAIVAMLINTVVCAAFATIDTYLITTAILAAALIMTIKGEHHG